MATLVLSKGLTSLVDDEDYQTLSQWKWSTLDIDTRHRYAVRREKGKMIMLHRQIMGAQKGVVVDHINGDSLDNRKCNLRTCSQMENTHNSLGHRDSYSKKKGVTLHYPNSPEGTKRWRARIMHDGLIHEIGLFITKDEAAMAYERYAKQIQGAFYPSRT